MYSLEVPMKFQTLSDVSYHDVGREVNMFLERYCRKRLEDQGVNLRGKKVTTYNLTNRGNRRRVMDRVISSVRTEAIRDIPYLVHSSEVSNISFSSVQEGYKVSLTQGVIRKHRVDIEYHSEEACTSQEFLRGVDLRHVLTDPTVLNSNTPEYDLGIRIRNTLTNGEFRYAQHINRKCLENGLPMMCEVPLVNRSSANNISKTEWIDGKGMTITWDGFSDVVLLFRWIFEGSGLRNYQGYMSNVGPVVFRFFSKHGKRREITSGYFFVENDIRIGTEVTSRTPPEIMLEEVDSMRKILSTLSRKFNYGHSAFSIGTPKDS